MKTDPETGRMVDKVKKASGMTDVEKKQVIRITSERGAASRTYE